MYLNDISNMIKERPVASMPTISLQGVESTLEEEVIHSAVSIILAML